MTFFSTGNGRWMAQQENVKYYVFLCKVNTCVFYALHRVSDDNYDLESIHTVGAYKSLEAAKNAAENDLLEISL